MWLRIAINLHPHKHNNNNKQIIWHTAKIAQLDKELKAYRDKLKTTKNAAAKKNIQKRAMEVLKRKRMYETQRDQLAGQQFNIDQAAFGIESAKASVSTVAAMKAANTELKKTIKNDLKIDDVDELADDMAELMDEFQVSSEGTVPFNEALWWWFISYIAKRISGN